MKHIKTAQLNDYSVLKTRLHLHSFPLLFYLNVCCNNYGFRFITGVNYIVQRMLVFRCIGIVFWRVCIYMYVLQVEEALEGVKNATNEQDLANRFKEFGKEMVKLNYVAARRQQVT